MLQNKTLNDLIAASVHDILIVTNTDHVITLWNGIAAEKTGISQEDAVSLIVDGFCKQVFRELPMEFAVEAKKLLEVSLEGSVG